MITVPLKLQTRQARELLPEHNRLTIEGLEIVVCTKLEGKEFAPLILQPGYRYKGDESGKVFFPGRIEGDSIIDYECDFIHSRRMQELVSKVIPSIIAQPDYTLWTQNGETVRYEPKAEVSEQLDKLSEQYTNQALATYTRSPEEARALIGRAINARECNMNAWAVLIALEETERKSEDPQLRKLCLQSYTPEDRQYVEEMVQQVKLAL